MDMARRSPEAEWQSTIAELDVPLSVRSGLEGTLASLAAHHLPTAEHCMRVGISAVRIGRHADLPLRPLFYGGSLHDRGKLEVPEHYLSKTSEWTAEDAAALRNHPLVGYEKTIDEKMVVTAGLIVRHHAFQPHRYPEEVPPAPPYMSDNFESCARVIALADYYDAAHRPNSAGSAAGEEIKVRMLAHNPDVEGLIHELYEAGIFDTSTRPF